jgi:hypothetical protein
MVKAKARKFAVVFDLEFTAWEGSVAARWSRPGEHTEVVQIGAVKLDAERLTIVEEFAMLVKPRVNPALSDYLVHGFLDFTGPARTWAFGRDDLILAANLKLYGWHGLTPPPYENALPWFAAQGIDLKGKHACDVPEAVGLSFEGQKHDALADAKGVAAGLVHLIRGGAPNPFLAE